MQGYNFWIDDDFQPHWMENTTDVGVEFIKLVDGLAAVDVPQDTVIEHEVISGVEGGTVT